MSRPRLTAPLATIGLAALLAGCASDTLGTQIEYDPSDGIGAQVGDLALRNLLVVSEGDGEPGVLSGAVVNTGTEPAEVTLALSDAPLPQDPLEDSEQPATSVDIDVEPGELVQIGPDSAVAFTVPEVSVRAGDLISMVASSPTAGEFSLSVPVLAPLREYATVTPSAPAVTFDEDGTSRPSSSGRPMVRGTTAAPRSSANATS